MSRRPVALLPMLVLPLVVLLAFSSTSVADQYVEDFTTKSYCDTINTTAEWDTQAGEIRLPPFEVTLAGSYDTSGTSFEVAIAGDYAYVANGLSGLLVLDVSDPTAPTLAGSYGTAGEARAVAVAGDHAYVADYGSGLVVVDISDPTAPTLAGNCNALGSAEHVAIAGDYAYVAAHVLGLQVLDISNPAAPTLAGTCSAAGSSQHVSVAGDHAYVADHDGGLQVIDITNPTAPTHAGNCDTPGSASGVVVAGDYAYVADGSSGLVVVDISDPTAPALAGSFDTSGAAQSVAVDGNHAYVVDGYDGLRVLDISNPTTPVCVWTSTDGRGYGVAIDGNHAYVAGTSGLSVLDVSAPMLPTPAGSYDTPGDAWDATISGNYAYVADGYSGVQVLDISDPTSLTLVGSCETPGYAYGVAISGDHAYVADVGSGIQVLDISDPTSPTLAGSYDTPGYAVGVAISGDRAYVADGYSGIQVLDISDPTSLTLVGSCETPGYAYGVAISGDHAYVANRYSGLAVLDISDPTTPTLAGSCDTPDEARRVTVSGDHAYVADRASGLQVLDISDPTSPALVGSYGTPGLAYGVTVSGDRAYLVDLESGLVVLDISDPTAPTYAGSCDTPGNPCAVAVTGDHAYVADGSSGLQVMEVLQYTLNATANIVQSLDIEPDGSEVYVVKLSTTQSDSILWELSADGGATWDGVLPADDLHEFTSPGSDLRWRSTFLYAGGYVTPACTNLQIEWLTGPLPLVASTLPAQNGLDVAVSTDISVTFEVDMSSATINDTTFIVNGMVSGPHYGTITYDVPTRTATLDPDRDFTAGEVVTVMLVGGIQSSNGAPFGDHSWSFTASASAGSGAFAAPVPYAAGGSAVVASDLDGDGDVDLATSGISVLMNNGDGTFAEPVSYAGGMDIFASDLDGDGDVDLATAGSYSSNDVSVLMNNGDGMFGAPVTYGNGFLPPWSVFASDLDGDGDADLVVGVTELAGINRPDRVKVFMNDGDGTFAYSGWYAVEGGSRRIFASDLDGDGDIDLVTTGDDSYDVSVLMNNGDGTFAAPAAYAGGRYHVFASDLDGDGDQDLAAASGSGGVSVLLNDGDGTFAPAVSYAVEGWAYSIFASDLDGDGDVDLATTDYEERAVSVLMNDGDGTFGAALMYGAGDHPVSVFAADLDGDGDVDLATTIGCDDCYPDRVSVLLNEDLIVASTTPAQHALDVAVSTDISVTFGADMNSATVNDTTFVVNGMVSGPHSGTITYDVPTRTVTLDPVRGFTAGEIVTVVLAAGIQSSSGAPFGGHSWSFTASASGGSGTFAPPVSYDAAGRDIFMSDLDGDGDIDSVTTGFDFGNISVLMNAGDGTFGTPVSYAAGRRDIFPCDLDGDGDVDLATVGVSSFHSWDISVLMNNGDGTFGAPVTYGVGGDPLASILASDLDGDGDADLVIGLTRLSGSSWPDRVLLLMNEGDGTFAHSGSYAVEGGARRIFASDLDGDGDVDLATTGNDSHDVSVLINNGDGTLAAPVAYAGGRYGVFASDLDGDGDVDLAAGSGSGGVSVLLNDGDGVFAPAASYAAEVWAYSIFASDLDGDGDIDLATTHYEECVVSVIMNDGDGTFGAPLTYDAGGYPVQVFASDLDGDGDVDLATTVGCNDCNPDRVAVLLNDDSMAGFTPIVQAGGAEANHEEIFECIYGDGFAPHGSLDYRNEALGILAVRVPDFVGDDPLAVGDNLEIGAPSPSATDQIWADGEVLAAAQARYASYNHAFGYFAGESGGAYEHLFDLTGFGCDVGGEGEVDFEPGSTWRWARRDRSTYSSRASDNAGLDAMVTYLILGSGRDFPVFVVFWEDIPGGVNDFNDAVFELVVLGLPPTEATVDFEPGTLNCRSHGRFVTCYIELPEGYDPADVDVSTVILNGELTALHHPTSVGDEDNDGIPDRMVKFDRAEVLELLPPGPGVEVVISGELSDQTAFAGTDSVRVICRDVLNEATATPSLPMLRVSPDSDGSSAIINYRAAVGQPVRLRVYDVGGRLIRTLVDGEASQDSCDVAWDGTADRGHRVGAGVYFVKLEAGGEVRTQKIAIVR